MTPLDPAPPSAPVWPPVRPRSQPDTPAMSHCRSGADARRAAVERADRRDVRERAVDKQDTVLQVEVGIGTQTHHLPAVAGIAGAARWPHCKPASLRGRKPELCTLGHAARCQRRQFGSHGGSAQPVAVARGQTLAEAGEAAPDDGVKPAASVPGRPSGCRARPTGPARPRRCEARGRLPARPPAHRECARHPRVPCPTAETGARATPRPR